MPPIELRLDGAEPVPGRETYHWPKLYHGAPYAAGLQIQYDDDSYLDWASYDDVHMQIRPSQGKAPWLTLKASTGELTCTADTLTVSLTSDETGAIAPVVYSPQPQVTQLGFVHDIELIANGEVVDRVAQGTGVLVLNTTRV